MAQTNAEKMASAGMPASTAAVVAACIEGAVLDGITAGTVTASKAVIVDANKDITAFRHVGLSGDVKDANGNELVDLVTTASAVNQVEITNQITGVSPKIGASGDDTNISLRLGVKATGVVQADARISEAMSNTNDTTAGAITITAAMIKAGILTRDPNGSARTDTLDSAANILAAFPGAKVGDVVYITIINNADAAETITIAVPASGSIPQIAGTRIIPQNTSRTLNIRFTNVTALSEAYVVYM